MWRFEPDRRVAAVFLIVAFTAATALSGCSKVAQTPPANTAPTATAAANTEPAVTDAPAGSGPAEPIIDSVWGVHFDGLPELPCCSAGLLGWSEIHVGQQVSLSGKAPVTEVGPAGRTVHSLRLVFPSGKELSIPVGTDGSFSQTVTFDEEGLHRIFRISGDRATDQADNGIPFTVAYLVETLDAPTVQHVFGPQHHDIQANKMLAFPQGKPTPFRVRFVDASGNPARLKTIRPKTDETEAVTTDADGIATLTFTPWEGEGHEVGYDLGPLYPGLAALSYKALEGGESGHLTGLAGGPLDGFKQNGQWYYPLAEFLKRAAPSGFANGFRPNGSVIELDLDWSPYVLTVAPTDNKPAGEVHDLNGKTVLNVAMINRADGPWLTLPDLARLFNLLAWGVLTPEGKLLISAPFIP